MAHRSLNTLVTTALAVAGVYAGPCKPSLASSSIVSVSSAFSSAETQSTTETSSTIEILTSTETLSTADTETTEALSTTTTDILSATIFELTTSAETTTAAATTTTEAACTVACTHVIGKSGVCTIPFQVATWNINKSWNIGSPTVADTAACADACASDCRCKSFASYGTSCDLYSGTQAQVNPPSFYLGPYFFDLAGCYECDD